MLACPPACGNVRSLAVPADSTHDHSKVVEWLRVLIAPGQVAELRAIKHDRGIVAGFFDHEHIDTMASTAIELSNSGSFKGIYVTLNTVSPALLPRAPQTIRDARELTKEGGVTKDGDILGRRWLMIDVDAERQGTCSATEQQKAKAKTKIEAIRTFLSGQGWPLPILADSGNGYHLLYRVDLPADDDGIVQGVLQALAKRFDGDGVKVDRTVFNPARITKVYGTMARKGEHTAERPHRRTAVLELSEQLVPVPLPLLEQLATPMRAVAAPVVAAPAQGAAGQAGHSTDVPFGRKIELARAYLAKIPPAIEGQNGDKRTYSVACRLVLDFDLTPEQALPLFEEWNRRCQPPWGVGELQRKLVNANGKPGIRGGRLRPGRGRPPQTMEVAVQGPPFLGTIPDFILADWAFACPRPRPRQENGEPKRGRRAIALGVGWFNYWEMIRQRSSRIILPDTVLGQLIWGTENRPANWRQKVADRCFGKKPVGTKRACISRPCGTDCTLHGRHGVPHQHLVVEHWVPERRGVISESYLGALELFAVNQNKIRAYNFSPAESDTDQESWEAIQQYRRSGRICSVYFPVLVFGYSPRSGLTHEQCQLLTALTHETTRARCSERLDRAAVVHGARASDGKAGGQTVGCPFLEGGKRYVGFNGNGKHKRRHLRGRGYRLLGKSGRGWLAKAAYEVPTEAKALLKTLRNFLLDLRALAEPFGLVVAGYDSMTKTWEPLAEMVAMTRTAGGLAWLRRCQLRVYTTDDYLARWRQYFAARMGFSTIPGDANESNTSPAPQPAVQKIGSAIELDRWMRRVGVTDAALAQQLGLSRSYVSRQRSGRSTWSKRFGSKVEAFQLRREG
jgi:hypothetical protein